MISKDNYTPDNVGPEVKSQNPNKIAPDEIGENGTSPFDDQDARDHNGEDPEKEEEIAQSGNGADNGSGGVVNFSEAERFLTLLDPDPNALFTFQTFSDKPTEPKRAPLTRVIHARRAELTAIFCQLERLNTAGAGIFVTINETNGLGRKGKDIARIRALYIDLDGASLEPVLASPRPPHIVVASSPGRWHCYWKVEGIPLEDFRGCQEALIDTFNSDRQVKSVEHVMRLPGFFHRKREPFLSRINRVDPRPPYIGSDFPKKERSIRTQFPSANNGNEPNLILATMVAPFIGNPDLDRYEWIKRGLAFFAATGGCDEGLKLFDALSRKSEKYVEETTAQAWESFRSSPPHSYTIASLIFWANQDTPNWREIVDREQMEIMERAARRDFDMSLYDLCGVASPEEQAAGAPVIKEAALELCPPDTGTTNRVGIAERDLDSDLPTQLRTRVKFDDFFAYMVEHRYIFVRTGDLWPAASVNSRLPLMPLVENGRTVLDEDGEPVMIKPSLWLDMKKPVEQMTWAPGELKIISGRMVTQSGWVERDNHTVFNLYRPPLIELGDADKAGPWLDHVKRIYPDDAKHIIKWCAHRVQKPGEKINHALVLGGVPGIGKDTMLEPVKRAVGSWNSSEVSPIQLVGRFNEFLKSVILCVNEARDRGEMNRYEFYEHLKAYTAAPPNTLRVDAKNIREYNVFNCCGVIITTNHRTDGIYLPANDRRHYVTWSDAAMGDFSAEYWNELWGWYNASGDRHVAACLATLDLSGWDAKAPPPKTAAFWDIVDAGRAPEESELADALDELDNPKAVALSQVISAAEQDLASWLRERKNRRAIPFRFAAVGYTAVRNDTAPEDGLWKVYGKRQVIYAKAELSLRDRLDAANALVRHPPPLVM